MTDSQVSENKQSYNKAWQRLKELSSDSPEFNECWQEVVSIEDAYHLQGETLREWRGNI